MAAQIEHIVLTVPYEDGGVTQSFGDPPEQKQSEQTLPLDVTVSGGVDATVERRRWSNCARLTAAKRPGRH